MNANEIITRLADYAQERGLLDGRDRTYAVNRLLDIFRLDSYESVAYEGDIGLEELLRLADDYAVEAGLIEDGITLRDIFDSTLMNELMARPSKVIDTFEELMATSPRAATEYFYKLCLDCDYIRTYRICKDMKWRVPSAYGDIDITINLSKPEKDPKAIAAARSQAQSGYPKCALCHENEGFRGTLTKAPRANLRQIPMSVGGETWFFQYSPYVYYNEHCILLSSEHTPMKISRKTFERMLDFVDTLPHYTIGSNADIPIVGGSILTHDHMQGGHYTFAMQNAPTELKLSFDGYPDIDAEIIKWPLSVIRLTANDKVRITDLAEKILTAWRGYTDENAFIFAETDGEPHNTVTPIARIKDARYQLDLVLRNNITTEEHPLGVYHPHADKHNIKKENIGLIEVMGLAVLPARLLGEMRTLSELLAAGATDISSNESVGKHASWLECFDSEYDFSGMSANEAFECLKKEIGKTFVAVLEDAGVYKCTPEGRSAFVSFTDFVNGKL